MYITGVRTLIDQLATKAALASPQFTGNVGINTLPTTNPLAIKSTASGAGSVEIGNLASSPGYGAIAFNPFGSITSANAILYGTVGQSVIGVSGGGQVNIRPTDGATGFNVFTGSQVVINMYGAGSANAQFEVKAKDGSTNAGAFYTSAGAVGLLVGPAGQLTIAGGTPITKVLSATATLDFPSTAAQTSSDLTVSVTGAAAGDAVTVTPPGTVDANACFTGRVSAADTVSVRFNNYSAGAIDPASGLYRVTVMKF